MTLPRFKPGDRVGRLTIISREGVDQKRNILWLTRCDCGATKILPTGHMSRGETRSCGCLQKELAGALLRTHGQGSHGKRTVEYKTWLRIKSRCGNPRNKDYAKYGAKGITVCERWKSSFEAFLSDMGLRPSDKHSIDRIDGTKGYSPDNCRWATPSVQATNTTQVRYVEVDGQRVILREAERLLGLGRERITTAARKRGISHQDALLHVLAKKGSRRLNATVVIDGKTMRPAEAETYLGYAVEWLRTISRKKNMTLQEAADWAAARRSARGEAGKAVAP